MKKVVFMEVDHIDEPIVGMWQTLTHDDEGNMPFYDAWLILDLNKISMD